MAEETYRGHKIVYSAAAEEPAEAEGGERQPPSLQVDGQDYEVVVHSDGTFSAKEYYYDKFGSLAALGRAIASRLPE
jgi:hypothetical protein